MRERKRFLPTVLILLVASIVLLSLSIFGFLDGARRVVESFSTPLQRSVFGLAGAGSKDEELARLREENRKLSLRIVDQVANEREIAALRDQFKAVSPAPSSLLPVNIIGRRANTLTIDKGERDGVSKGDVVVYEDNLVGVVDTASAYASIVKIVTHEDISFTAETLEGESSGVVKGQGSDLIFDNVVLTEKIEKGNIIVTRGDTDASGEGVLPGLIVGRIGNVHKNASDLFQSAEIESLVDFGMLRMVFILTDNK
jgi:rod shape-determining protein MreC